MHGNQSSWPELPYGVSWQLLHALLSSPAHLITVVGERSSGNFQNPRHTAWQASYADVPFAQVCWSEIIQQAPRAACASLPPFAMASANAMVAFFAGWVQTRLTNSWCGEHCSIEVD